MSTERRTLKFERLSDAVEEVRQLQTGGWIASGQWDLAQICLHLSEWLKYPVDGFPKAPGPVRALLWMMRTTMGRRMLEKTLASGSMPVGGPTMKETVFKTGGKEQEAVERFREAVKRFEAHVGEYHPSPLFGPLTRDEALRLQLVHCAHHLSFLTPRIHLEK